mmetsp:Transcript_5857/g.14998  ORF Transcript_5857/g.14998 Transcript_5857/m.14998 type:complete len:343 (+) Transcript_5857:3-1031(+)
MYTPSFIDEFLKPQEMYSVTSVRQIFDRLAHSSIMRLNEASMDKLFDLMLMGFKYQLLSCTHPKELLLVTQNHLSELAAKVGDSAVAQMVTDVSDKVAKTYGALGAGEWGRLRRALCSFFQDRKVKVSLFLQDGIQRADGTIAVNPTGPMPPGIAVPGTIETFAAATGASKGSSSFEHPLGASLQPPDTARVCELGFNLYDKDRTQATDATESSDIPAPPPQPAAPAAPVPDSQATSKQILAGEHVTQAKEDLNLLASLVATSGAPSAPLKINLFPETLDVSSSGPQEPGKVPTITIDFKKEGGNRRKELDELVSGLSVADDQGSGGGGDDLLALMDQAGHK